MKPQSAKQYLTTLTHNRGAALIAILWVIAILSLAVFSATQLLFVSLVNDSNDSSIFRAQQLADRGIAIASHPKIKRSDPLLRQQLTNEESYETRISSEGDRLNLNSLLESHATNRIVLEELFVRWGLRRDRAEDVIDNLIDWVDADDESTNQGAERSFYFEQGRLNQPFNRRFDALDEVALVDEFNLVASVKPDWKDAFTLMSAGQLDLNEAPAELIACACQIGMVVAEEFVELRNGFDRIPGTEDDLRYESLEQALSELRIPVPLWETVSARVAISDPSRRIISVGRSGTIAVERAVTVQYNNQAGGIMKWTTRRIE
jgi:type II secretory pathway component PulK